MMVMKLVSASMLALLLCVFTLPGVTSFTARGASLLARPCPLSFSPSSPRSPTLRTASAISMAAVKKSKLAKTLNKKTLTVSVDVAAGDAMLSKRLRTTGVATIFADAAVLPVLAEEQQAAKGDFPGPVPVILRDQEINADAIAAAKKAGATGVVIKFGSEGAGELAASATELGLEAMWEVTSKEEFAGATEAGAGAFLVSSIEDSFGVAPGFWEGLEKDSIVVAEIKALQPGNSEIGLGKSLGAAGCKAVLLSGACTGGAEDHRYVDAALNGLRSKRSEEFQMAGLLGKASPVGLANRQSHSTKEPTIIKEKLDVPHML